MLIYCILRVLQARLKWIGYVSAIGLCAATLWNLSANNVLIARFIKCEYVLFFVVFFALLERQETSTNNLHIWRTPAPACVYIYHLHIICKYIQLISVFPFVVISFHTVTYMFTLTLFLLCLCELLCFTLYSVAASTSQLHTVIDLILSYLQTWHLNTKLPDILIDIIWHLICFRNEETSTYSK